MLKVQAVILDIDGTLWDSTEVVAAAWNKAIVNHTDLDVTLTGEGIKPEFGKPLDEIMLDLFPQLSENERKTLGRHCYRYENEECSKDGCIVYDGVVETIKKLHDTHRVFIVSNCQDGYIESFLAATKLHDFVDDFTCPGYTGKLKGDNIRIIRRRNGVGSAVYVGDIMADFTASQKAGVGFIHARYGFGQVENPPYAIDNFSQLLDIIE